MIIIKFKRKKLIEKHSQSKIGKQLRMQLNIKKLTFLKESQLSNFKKKDAI